MCSSVVSPFACSVFGCRFLCVSSDFKCAARVFDDAVLALGALLVLCVLLAFGAKAGVRDISAAELRAELACATAVLALLARGSVTEPGVNVCVRATWW